MVARKAVFAWQSGYAAFSVSPDRINAVKQYIRNQEKHHKRIGFEEELVTLLDESGIPYDPQYLV